MRRYSRVVDSPNQPQLNRICIEVPRCQFERDQPHDISNCECVENHGISFDEATQLVASDLGIDKQLAVGDYSASNSAISREIHMFARGVTAYFRKHK
ncbi:hypothetical protein O9993_15900 [Vibrio lentus]|nr:hypothetical protein [Vibrio lentus]